MTSLPTSTSSFDVLSEPVGDQLLAAATAATARAIADPAHGVLVVVVRPGTDDHHVIGGGGTGFLRAAVSVAAAAGNDRAWRDAPDRDTAAHPVRALPEVIAAAAEADGARVAHTGCVRVDGTIESVAIWFESWQGVAAEDTRRAVLHELAAAGERERTRRAGTAQQTAPVAALMADRGFDPADPDLDAVTGLFHADRFASTVAGYDRDEAMLVLLDLDGFERVRAEWGDDACDRVVRIVADRLALNCRRHDTIARLGDDRFAVLFGELDRSEVVQIAKRLQSAIAEPLPAGTGPDHVTATVALAHQVGLVDLDEMLESAADALASGKRSGSGRLVLAA